jgi:hypothetical protein
MNHMKRLLTIHENTVEVIDEALTPENAADKGFLYMNNVYNPSSGILEIIELAKRKGYKFGNPKQNDPNLFLGLYKPVKKIKRVE